MLRLENFIFCISIPISKSIIFSKKIFLGVFSCEPLSLSLQYIYMCRVFIVSLCGSKI